MSVTPEELAAYADGELSEADEARVAAAVEADTQLAARVAAHHKLKARLAGHYAPILNQPVPDRLSDLLGAESKSSATGIADFTAAKQRREGRRFTPTWTWGGAAIAASLVAALVLTTRSGPDTDHDYAGMQLASALDAQLVASQPSNAENRILLSFRNDAGEFCRAFSGAETSGIACRDDEGWRLEAIGDGASSQPTEFRMAGSEAQLLELAQEMAIGSALSAEEETAALEAGWQD